MNQSVSGQSFLSRSTSTQHAMAQSMSFEGGNPNQRFRLDSQKRNSSLLTGAALNGIIGSNGATKSFFRDSYNQNDEKGDGLLLEDWHTG